ncbi:MAG: 2-oxo acid dehydrogenase subunit E2 [Desulfomonilaceae bacterium]
MAVKITMPKWGMTMKEGKITKWFKKEGDSVTKGEALFEVETEKITNKVESTVNGILFQIVVPAGAIASVGAVVALVAEPGEKPTLEEKPPEQETGAKIQSNAEAPKINLTDQSVRAFVPASPAAKRLARELGINLSLVVGSGPGGRIIESDVTNYKNASGDNARITPLALEIARQKGLDISGIKGTGDRGKITREDVENALKIPNVETSEDAFSEAKEEPLFRSISYSGMRRSIGENMISSLHTSAQLTAFAEIDVTEMVAFLDLLREEFRKDESVKISYNDIIVLAVSRALKRHPRMNSLLVGGEILEYDSVNMGIAVALEQGLIVPVLHEADKKGLLQIANEARELATRAREGKLTIEEVTGGTFTISNTSMYEVDGFTPILRPPETGILGVGRIKKKPAEYRGEIALRNLMTISLTYDHRVVDGVPAHKFLETVGKYLQHPMLIMI